MNNNRLTMIVGNLAFEQVISVANKKNNNMMSNTLLSSIKSVLGTCQAMGIYQALAKGCPRDECGTRERAIQNATGKEGQ
jgi:hypothetical protein